MTFNEKYTDILAKCYNDCLQFVFSILPNHFNLRPAEFHKKIYDLLFQGWKYVCIVAPRGHSKSTTITLGFVLHQILFKRKHFILIISDTYTQAEMFLDAIKKEIETNWIIKLLFGDLVGKEWGEGEITTANDIKIVAKGTGNKIRGLKYKQWRPDLIICDDLENEELVSNSERRDKTERWFYGSVMPSLADDGQLVIVGTILHYASLLMKLSGNPEFKGLFFRAIENGEPLWKEKFSLEQLEGIKNNYRSQGLLDVFYCEYMNDPISEENAIFKKSYFKYWGNDEVLYNALSKFTTVDLAISKKETADYNVVLTVGIDALNQIYIIEYWRQRATPGEVIDEIFRQAETHKVITIGIESVAYQRAMIWFFEEEMRKRNKFFMVEELKADVDKERRIKGLQPRYACGSIYHKANMGELEEELLLFPKSPHDDIADALAYVPQIGFVSVGSSKLEGDKPSARTGETTMVDIKSLY
jgi:predicted phage terminase large subunit-like protein